jgi:hypothetical protein
MNSSLCKISLYPVNKLLDKLNKEAIARHLGVDAKTVAKAFSR